MNDEGRIRELLARLPRERLSPEARALVESAAPGRPAAQRMALRAAVGDLLRGGHLVRLAADGASGVRGPLFLLRGSSQVLDLSALGGEDVDLGGNGKGEGARDDGPRAAEAPDDADGRHRTGAPDPPTARDARGGDLDAAVRCEAADGGGTVAAPPSTDGVGGVLEAMERAQDLAVGDPRTEEPGVMVSRILALLGGYVPSVHLRAQLLGDPQDMAADAESDVLPAIPPDQAPFWLRCRAPGQAVWIPDPAELPVPLQRQLGGLPAPVTAVVPLWSPAGDGGELGLLYVSATHEERDGLMRLAQRLSAFVTRRWRCQHDVNRRVLTDSLTGIRNRAFFDTQFPLELERARRGDFPLTLVIGDLDHFKAINDTYHHQCGDRVLQGVARLLQEALRRIDYVCRIGGEEFALILPYTSQEEAAEVLGRLVGQPMRVPLAAEWGTGAVSVTMSYGAVTFPDAGSSAGELHRKADSMLYRAKELGRNRCCIWVGPGRHQELLPSRSRAADH